MIIRRSTCNSFLPMYNTIKHDFQACWNVDMVKSSKTQGAFLSHAGISGPVKYYQSSKSLSDCHRIKERAPLRVYVHETVTFEVNKTNCWTWGPSSLFSRSFCLPCIAHNCMGLYLTLSRTHLNQHIAPRGSFLYHVYFLSTR